ncbi:MAG: metal ABC transporter permease [Candidatus Bipolaricaulota bacterium]|nr:metal ABC transporter permease [Candidatus Bipolaricaulota bacterium]
MYGLPWSLIFTLLGGAALTGATCGLLGTFVVRLRLSSLGFTMSHAAFAGAALGLALGIEPLTLALIGAILTAAVLGPVAERAKLPADVITGVLFPLTMALGLIFLYLAPGTAMSSSALGLLWGSLFAMAGEDLLRLLGLAGAIALTVWLFFKEFQALLFDRKLAEESGVPTRPFYYLILFLTGVTIALALRLVGGLLVFVLLQSPAATAFQFSYDLKKIFFWAALLGVIYASMGLGLSFALDLPLGSAIVLVSTLGFGLAVWSSPKRRRT